MHECPKELRKSALFILNANGASLLLAASFKGQGSSKQKGTAKRSLALEARGRSRRRSRPMGRAKAGPLYPEGGVFEGGPLGDSRPPSGLEGAHS